MGYHVYADWILPCLVPTRIPYIQYTTFVMIILDFFLIELLNCSNCLYNSGSGFVALATLAQISRANWIGSGSFIRLACLNGGLGGGATARRVFLSVGALATV